MAGVEAPAVQRCRAINPCLLDLDANGFSCKCSACPSGRTYSAYSKTADEKNSFTSSYCCSSLSSKCLPGKMSNLYSESDSDAQKDCRSPLSENFMVSFSKSTTFDSLRAEDVSLSPLNEDFMVSFPKSTTFDSLRAEDVSLGHFAFVETSGEMEFSQLSQKQRVTLGQHLETHNFNSLVVETKEDIGELESNKISNKIMKKEIEAHRRMEYENTGQPFSLVRDGCGCIDATTAISSEGSKHKQKEVSLPKLQSSGKFSWRTADTEELAALVARKSLEHLENCDLPPSQAALVQKGILRSGDLGPSKKHRWDMSRSMDRDSLFSLIHERMPLHIETQKFSSQYGGRSDSLPLSDHAPHTPKSFPVVREHITHFMNQDGQLISSKAQSSGSSASGGCIQESDHGPQLLGEALCRSQTRARESEKAAAQVFLEKERLTRLFFREASLSLTYRQWVDSLQAENMCLRLHAGDKLSEKVKQNLVNTCATFGLLANTHYGPLRKDLTQKEMQQYLGSLSGSKDSKHRRSSSGTDIMAKINAQDQRVANLCVGGLIFMYQCGLKITQNIPSLSSGFYSKLIENTFYKWKLLLLKENFTSQGGSCCLCDAETMLQHDKGSHKVNKTELPVA